MTLPESKVVTRVLNFDTVYVADSEKDYDSSPEMMSEGKSGLETTTISYTLSNEGEVIENSPVVNVVEPQSRTIKIGTKPTVKLEDVPFTTRYIGDDSLEKESQKEETAGINGVITTKTTYTLDSKTGQVTMTTEAPQITKPMVERIVKVGTKPTLAVEEIAFDTEYRSDETKSVGNDVTSGGKVGRKEVRTTYRVDEQTGKLTQDTVESRVLEQPVTRIITKGTKPEVVTTAVPYETEYVADEELEVGTVSAVGGEAGEKEVVTTYDVDKATGKMTAIAGDEREVKAPTKKVVTKGTKPSVRIEEQDFSTRYVADESLTKGEQIEETPGKKQVTTFTKTYSLDKVTGNVVANSETSRVTTTMQERVVKVGTKSTSRVTTKPFTIRYESDDTMPKGEQRISVKGVEEVTTHTETYALNTTTGVVTANPVTSEVTTLMVEQVVKVGTRPILTTSEVTKEDGKRYSRTTKTTYTVDPKTGAITEHSEHEDTLIPEDKVKPEIEVTKVTTDEDTSSATLTYRKSDPSQTFRKISVKLYDEQNQVIKTIDSNTLEDLNLVLTELKPYVTYKVETTVHYDLDKGEETEVLEKKEIVEIIPKRIEFRNVSSKALYKVSEDGSMSIVTGLTSIPNDKQNYLVKLVNDGREVVLPVASFAQKGDKIAVTVEHPKLVTFVAPTETTENYTLEIEKTVTGDGIYTSFDDLIRDMKTNSRDVYRLGSDLHATDTSDLAYVPNFTKKLTSVDGKQYAIIGLKKPLINTLAGGTVENVILKDVNITSAGDLGTVAIQATQNANIAKVKANGVVNYRGNDNVTNSVGGLIGAATGATLSKNYVEVDITVNGGRYNNISGLVGKISSQTGSSNISQNYYGGDIKPQNTVSPNVSGLVSQAFGISVVDNISNYSGALLGDYVALYNTTRDNKKVGQDITQEAANAKLKEWGLIKEEAPSPTPAPSNQSFDYSVAKNYQANRMTAYRNMEKLLPVYDRHTIVKYGNLVPAGSLLATKVISSVTPMTDGDFNVNLLAKDQPNKLFIRYDDNTSEIVNLTQVGPFKNTDVIEYSFNNDLLFTLAQFNRSETTLVDKLKAQLSPVELDTAAVKNVLKLDAHNKAIKDQGLQYENSINDLYLDQSFAEVKANLDTILSKLLSNNDLTYLNNDTVQKTIVKKVSDNKEKIMLGLAYLNRLYGIHYDTFNIKDLVMLNPRFYGKEIDNIDVLIELGSQGFENLMVHNNLETYKKVLANKLDSADLLSFLDKNRTLLTTKSANEWFRSSTKAFTHEVASTVLPDANVEIYTRLQQKGTYKTYILPLLNLKADDVYVITTLSTIYFGGYGRSVDNALKQSDPSNYRKQVSAVHDELKKASSRWGAYNDLYLKLSGETERTILKTKLTEVFDGYFIKDSGKGQPDAPYFTDPRRWATKYDKDYNAVYDFFGPIGRWYNKSPRKDSAYADRVSKKIYFDYVDILGGQGGATLNHELVHAYDEDVLLQGHKYRDGQSTESYAYGLFESVTSANTHYYGFNFMYDIAGGVHNDNISRFNSKDDLKSYAKGVSDVTYLLDGLEAEVIVTKSADQQAQLLRKMEMKTVVEEGATHANDLIKDISAADLRAMNLTSVSDFVERDLVAKTTNLLPKEYMRDNFNNYYTVPLYYPIYAAYQNNQGTVGGLMFRRVIFDLLSEYGWDKGFVGYASNQYKPSGQVMTDEIAFREILDKKYAGSYKAFKKDMFAQRLAKQDQIKAITIRGQQVTSGQELKALLQTALEEDLAKGVDRSFARQTLKSEILREFNKVTNNFRTSIFK
ncbi:ZmpA/ZmpB/ZmpC family metallo-endopeptidase [Streptococcus fryi]